MESLGAFLTLTALMVVVHLAEVRLAVVLSAAVLSVAVLVGGQVVDRVVLGSWR